MTTKTFSVRGIRAGALTLVVALSLFVIIGASSCGGSSPARVEVDRSRGVRVETVEYLPGVRGDLYLPDGDGRAPVVVLVPGGAWRTADPRGLAPLAEKLAASGAVVFNATHRAVADGVTFPTPVQDVICSVGLAADRASARGATGPVVVVGHSTGAHLAALAALATEHFRTECPWPPASVDGFAGLAGLYDVRQVPDLAEPLLGGPPDENPERWQEANPSTWSEERRDLPVLLAHGDADELVPHAFSVEFASVLEAAGHPVRLELIPGGGHHDLYQVDVIGDLLLDWIASLPSAGQSMRPTLIR